MRAVTLEPRRPGSLRLEDVPEPTKGASRVRTRAVGICGTDRELIDGRYGEAPPGRLRLVLGHESLGRVVDAPPQSSLRIGDSVVGVQRDFEVHVQDHNERGPKPSLVRALGVAYSATPLTEQFHVVIEWRCEDGDAA